MTENKSIQNKEQEDVVSSALQLHTMTLAEKLKYGTSAAVPVGLGLELFGGGFGGIAVAGLIGITAAYFSEEIREGLIDKLPVPKSAGSTRRSKLDWFLTGRGSASTPTVVDADQAQPVQVRNDQQSQAPGPARRSVFLDEEPAEVVTVSPAPESDDAALFAVRSATETGGVQRLTVEQIVKHCEPNSYKIFIGRSLTQKDDQGRNLAVQINIYKRHFRFMGASQRGKSSMVAAFLDIVSQTHDKKHVLLAILDKEDQTGKLFGHLPHVASLQIAGDRVKLHARNDDQVLEYLTYIVAIMNQRYKLSKLDVQKLPILLTYIEEFLSLKNTFKSRMGQAKNDDEKKKATSDYNTLVYCIEELAQRGLKARVQLLLCAQVEYADDDFKEALVNIDCGFSFCVRPTAASAAGFRNNALLQRNAKENKVGQAVVETPDCNDLVLAPEYPLEERLTALEKANGSISETASLENVEMPILASKNAVVNGSAGSEEAIQSTQHLRLLVNRETSEIELREAEEPSVNVNVNAETRKIIKRMVDMGNIPHNKIAKVVGLDGRHYPTYKQVCKEMGIATEREA